MRVLHLKLPQGLHHRYGYLPQTVEAGGVVEMRYIPSQMVIELTWPKDDQKPGAVCIPTVQTQTFTLEDRGATPCKCEPDRHKTAEAAERCPNK